MQTICKTTNQLYSTPRTEMMLMNICDLFKRSHSNQELASLNSSLG